MRADLNQIALKIMSLPLKISLIQLIPGSVRFCEFRKAAFHDTTLYVSLHVRKRQICFFGQCGPTSVCFFGKFKSRTQLGFEGPFYVIITGKKISAG